MKSQFKQFNEKIEWNIKSSDLWLPHRSDFSQFKIDNHEFEEVRATWSQVRKALKFEHSLLTKLEKAADLQAEWFQVSDELYEDFENPIQIFDLGIASVVLALSAMGCVTVTSCNGGFLDGSHKEKHPLVVFYARAKDGPFLLDTAKASQVGISNENGPLIVWANDIWHMLAFAEKIFKSRGKRPKTKPSDPRLRTNGKRR